jgi:hypothetical protein
MDSSDLELKATNCFAPLKYKTVKVYNAAITKLYYTQVSISLNMAPSFQGVAFKGFIRDLQCTQEKRA